MLRSVPRPLRSLKLLVRSVKTVLRSPRLLVSPLNEARYDSKSVVAKLKSAVAIVVRSVSKADVPSAAVRSARVTSELAGNVASVAVSSATTAGRVFGGELVLNPASLKNVAKNYSASTLLVG